MSSTRTSLQPTLDSRVRTICCHGGTLSGRWAPNALEGILECAASNVPRLEVDVRFMADDSMVLLHNDLLEDGTTGAGHASGLTRSAIRGIQHCGGGGSIGFLDDVVGALQNSETLLQVDLKLLRPITPRQVRGLLQALAPLDGRVLVGSQAHWGLRELSGVRVALDPSMHLRAGPAVGVRPDGPAPAVLGVYGFWDDSPSASAREWSAADYLESRITDLLGLLPNVTEWMVDIPTILRMGELGLSLGDRLHREGVELAAWTVRARTAERACTLQRLFEFGVDTVITDVPMLVANDLRGLPSVNPV
jgi:glycerophosphoryl diester phosphodiesterase